MSISRTKTISSWSSAKTASLITSDLDQNYLSAFCFLGGREGWGGVTRDVNEKRGEGGVVTVGIEGKG